MALKTENRQKLAAALLLPALGLIAYGFSGAWNIHGEVNEVLLGAREMKYSLARLEREVSQLELTEAIRERSMKRIEKLCTFSTPRGLRLTQEQLDTWRYTIGENRLAAKIDDGKLEQFRDAGVYPYLSQVASSLRTSLQTEDDLWVSFQSFLEIHTGLMGSEENKEA